MGRKVDPTEQMEVLLKAVAEKNGLLISPPIYLGSHKKYQFKCSNPNHPEFKATFHNITGSAKQWCPICSHDIGGLKNRANSYDQMEKLRLAAEARGGQLLSTEYIGSHKKYQFKCSNPDHPIFLKNLDSICGKRKEWCPRCAGRAVDKTGRQAKIQRLRLAAEARGGQLLSTEYIGANAKYQFKCSNPDHPVFENNFNGICGKYKQWCPLCNNLKTEPLIRKILETYYQLQSKKIRPKWLRNSETNRPLEIDIWFEDLSLAFEVHGYQHFTNTHHDYSKSATKSPQELLFARMERDLLKEKKIIQRIRGNLASQISAFLDYKPAAQLATVLAPKHFHIIPIGYDQNGKRKETWTPPEMIAHINYHTGLNIPLDLALDTTEEPDLKAA